MEKDCVCGSDIDKESSTSFDYKGKTYHFCSDKCRDEFTKSPDNYTSCM